ncbi:MAG: hypothetical protein ACJ768_10655 [Gaiellaceae bacterium]
MGRRAMAAGVLVVAVLASGAGGAPTRTAWFDRGVHVVGGPVAADGRVLALVSTADRATWLEAFDPDNGKVQWKLPEAFSEITPGVEVDPLAHGHTVLALVPDSAATGTIRLEGVDISTGTMSWRSASAFYLADAPTACPKPMGDRAFCVVGEGSSFGPTLVALSPATGAVLASVPHVQRAMGLDVYQSTSTAPTLLGVRVPGGLRWSRSVASLYGAGYGPDYGWNFDRFGVRDVGEIGKKPVGKTLVLNTSKTLGLDASTGRRVWSDAGSFECDGAAGLSDTFLCVLTGTARFAHGHITVSHDATGILEGFRPISGAITWRVPVGHLAALMMGNVEVTDAHHMLVWSPHGQALLLDLRTGKTTTPARSETFWCEKDNLFKIRPPKGIGPLRVGSSFITPCDVRGRAVTANGVPPGTASATVGGMTVWASPSGLAAAPS